MNEQEKLTPQNPDESETQEEKASPPARSRSVFLYLAVLFGAAFMLLLFAYLMQQRDSQEISGTLSQLRESMGSIESLDQLVEENHLLREEMESMEEDAARLQEERDGLNTQLEELQKQYTEAADAASTQEKELTAWHAFWQLEADFLAEDYEGCAEYFRTQPADDVPYPTGEGVQERVEEIYDELVKQGVLTEGEGWMAPEAESAES